MKKHILIATALLVLGLIPRLLMADVTQTSDWSLNDGARDRAPGDVVVIDLPAIITALNAVDGLSDGTDSASVDDLDVGGDADVTGTLGVTGASTFANTITAVSTNGATTNVIVTVDGVIDGETIKDDTIDDDSIDLADVTGADLTLTDCTAVTASGAVYGGTVGFSAATGYFAIVSGTQLVFIASSGSVTNVIDADIGN